MDPEDITLTWKGLVAFARFETMIRIQFNCQNFKAVQLSAIFSTLFIIGPLFVLVSPWTKDTIKTMKSIPHVYPCE